MLDRTTRNEATPTVTMKVVIDYMFCSRSPNSTTAMSYTATATSTDIEWILENLPPYH